MTNKLYHPLIGVCVSEDKRLLRDLVKFRVKKFRRNTNTSATVFRFHIEDMNFNEGKVKGEIFEKKSREWKEDIFPFPDSIFVQSHVDPATVKKLEQAIGRKVFNNFIFDKWQGFELLEKSNVLRQALPETVPLKGQADLLVFLNAHKDVFLKPINGHSSRKIVRATLQKEGTINVSFMKYKKMRNESFKSFSDFWDWFTKHFFNVDYIIQKSIETVRLDDHATDVRLNMNKDSRGSWVVSALILRIATNESHIIPDVSTVLTTKELIKMYPMEKKKWKKINNSVVKLGRQICNVLEKSGYHMGNLGIDLGLDENGHLWIFEVNPLPYPLDDIIEDNSLTKPLEYALYLASK